MTDLRDVLPDFDLKPFRHLIYSLEKNEVTVSDLVAFDPIEIAKRCPLPLGDLKALVQAVVRALHDDMGVGAPPVKGSTINLLAELGVKPDVESCEQISKLRTSLVVKTLDPKIDQCLGGGFHTGHLTEVVGESAVGKTQFALSLLLSCQLPPPHGLGKSAIYLSTESPLNTTRLMQMLSAHPHYQTIPEEERPSLDRIHAIATNDLEVQERIIRHQLQLAVERLDVGLVVMDSVAANFRAEHETRTPKGLADRAADLTKLGTMLRQIARDNDIVVVVTNQVSDRFDDVKSLQDRTRSSSPMADSSPALYRIPPMSSLNTPRDERLGLDHQMRFFTGWGEKPRQIHEQLKTPALGLAWANQLSARVVLKMESDWMVSRPQNYGGGNIWKDKKKKRFLAVVFAPWVAPTMKPVQYEIQLRGPTSITEKPIKHDPHADLLDPSLWLDGANDGSDEEFP